VRVSYPEPKLRPSTAYYHALQIYFTFPASLKIAREKFIGTCGHSTRACRTTRSNSSRGESSSPIRYQMSISNARSLFVTAIIFGNVDQWRACLSSSSRLFPGGGGALDRIKIAPEGALVQHRGAIVETNTGATG